MDNHEYFAELFNGPRTETQRFRSSTDAVTHFQRKHGVNLLAVKRVATAPTLVFSA